MHRESQTYAFLKSISAKINATDEPDNSTLADLTVGRYQLISRITRKEQLQVEQNEKIISLSVSFLFIKTISENCQFSLHNLTTLSSSSNHQRELSPRIVQVRKILYECDSKCSTHLNLDYTKPNKECLS